MTTQDSELDQLEEIFDGLRIRRRTLADWDKGVGFTVVLTEGEKHKLKQAILALIQEAKTNFIKTMLQAEQDNREAGHKWSRGDFMKYLQYELDELRQLGDKS